MSGRSILDRDVFIHASLSVFGRLSRGEPGLFCIDQPPARNTNMLRFFNPDDALSNLADISPHYVWASMEFFLIVFVFLTMLFLFHKYYRDGPGYSSGSGSGSGSMAQANNKKLVEELRDVGEYIVDKYIDGLCIGVLLGLTGWFDKDKTFISSVDELMTNLHPTIVLFGGIGAAIYLGMKWYLPLKHAGWTRMVLRLARAWFDLVQQFFALALGAFLPIKVFLVLHENQANKSECYLNEHVGGFVAILFFSTLFSGMWVLKNQVPQSINRSAVKRWHIVLFILIGLVAAGWLFLLFGDLPSVTSGLKSLNHTINHFIDGNCK